MSADARATDRTALFIGAHPPGAGSGSSVRGLTTLRTLRQCCGHVDAIAFATPDERPFAAPGVQFIERPLQGATRAQYLRTVLTSGTMYYPERHAGLTGHFASRVANGELKSEYDVVWVHSSLMAHAAIECFHARTYVLDVDNVASADARRAAANRQASPSRRLLRWLDVRAISREERRRMAAFADVVVCSDRERRLIGSLPGRVRVIPNVVEGPDDPYNPAVGETLLFVGNLGYDANVGALGFFVGEVLPRILEERPQTRVVVAGRSPGDTVRALARHPAIDLIPDVPDLEPLYKGARAVVAPMREGGGTRIKVLEAMARGTPVVLTPDAAEGLNVTDGREAFIEREPAGYATRCKELLEDPTRASAMGGSGRRYWEAHHRPEVAMERIVEIATGNDASPDQRAHSAQAAS